MTFIHRLLQVLLPLALLAGGAALVHPIASSGAPPVVAPPAASGPLIRVAGAVAVDVQLEVASQGTVEPLRIAELSAQVGGRVLATGPALRAGGAVAAGELLVRIDPADYELAVVQQEAAVARAELRLLQERAEADAALRAWRELEGDRPADPLARREPQIREAEAALAAARAQLAKSRLDHARTEVTAPFAGRIQRAAVELGQTVQPGQVLAVLLDVATVEVRLPLPLADTAFVELPLHGESDDGPQVVLTAEFGGSRHEWRGRIVRTESEIDRQSRQLTAVARVAPGANDGPGDRPPLLPGAFVQARVLGRTHAGVVAVPRAALRDGGVVWVVDAEHRLRRRQVDVLRSERDRVLLHGGVAAGERVCVTPLETTTDGLPVRIAGDGPETTGQPGR